MLPWKQLEEDVRRIGTPCVWVAVLLAAACRPGAVPLTETRAAAIRDSVTVAMERFREVGASTDREAIAAFYSESPAFRFYENGTLRYRSAADVRAGLEGLAPGMRITTEYTDTDIVALAPGLAQVRTRFESTVRGEDGFEFNYGGAATMLWAHEPGGWRILSGHTSAPVPRGG